VSRFSVVSYSVVDRHLCELVSFGSLQEHVEWMSRANRRMEVDSSDLLWAMISTAADCLLGFVLQDRCGFLGGSMSRFRHPS
jgi:hypothetical protein